MRSEIASSAALGGAPFVKRNGFAALCKCQKLRLRHASSIGTMLGGNAFQERDDDGFVTAPVSVDGAGKSR